MDKADFERKFSRVAISAILAECTSREISSYMGPDFPRIGIVHIETVAGNEYVAMLSRFEHEDDLRHDIRDVAESIAKNFTESVELVVIHVPADALAATLINDEVEIEMAAERVYICQAETPDGMHRALCMHTVEQDMTGTCYAPKPVGADGQVVRISSMPELFLSFYRAARVQLN